MALTVKVPVPMNRTLGLACTACLHITHAHKYMEDQDHYCTDSSTYPISKGRGDRVVTQRPHIGYLNHMFGMLFIQWL